jgi:Nitroreductase family.
LLGGLSRAKESGSSFLKGAALGVVVTAVREKSDVWVADCSIASIILQLVGSSPGLGFCWIQIRKRGHSSNLTSEDYVKQMLGLTEDFLVQSIISFGYPDEVKRPVPAGDLQYDKILAKENH